MASKPELSVAQQTQAPGVQNVVLYVSNDNIAQAYATAVGQQHIAHQTNGLVYGNGNQISSGISKGYNVNKPILKPPGQGLQSNGVIDTSGFYQSNQPTPVLSQNGNFPQQCPAIQTYSINHSHQQNAPSAPSIVNQTQFSAGAGLKSVIGGFNGNSSEIFANTVRQKRDDENNPYLVGAPGPAGGGGGADNGGAFVTVMGAEVANTPAGMVFPRCDSVRSETAESSCSSLSSGDGPNEAPPTAASGGLVLLPSAAGGAASTSQPPSDVLVYDSSGVSVGMRPGHPLVLTMVPSVQQSTETAHAGMISVPLGWKRILTNGVIIYVSPSSTALSSLDQIKEYLQTPGTCKCGLECPLKCDNVFNFDPKVIGKPWTLTPDTNIGDLTKLCNHKRKLLALTSASSQGKANPVVGSSLHPTAGGEGLGVSTPTNAIQQQQQQQQVTSVPTSDPSKLRKDGNIKRKKRKMTGPYSGISVSQLLAQRDKLIMAQQLQSNQHPHSTQMWSQSVQMQQSNNRVGNFVDPSNGQIIRYQNTNQLSNRVLTNSPMLVGNTMMVQQNQQQPHQTFQPNQPQILQQQTIHGNQQQSQMLMQNNGNQQILTHNQQPQIHHNILGPNGQVISVQSQQNPNNHNQMMQNSLQQQGIVIHNPQTIQQPQQQRVVLNEELHQNHSIQPQTNITINMSGQNMQHEDMFQRLQAQQFNQQINRSESDQIKILHQQIDNKNNRHFISNNSNQTFNNGNVVPHQMNNPVMITQHKTPPWQQNKMTNHSQPNQINSQNIVITSQNSGSVGNIYERVPPLHHHTPPPPVWNEDVKKKTKICKSVKKQRPYNLVEHRGVQNEQMACPNIDVRQIPMEHRQMQQQQQQPSSSPSFMEDPSGYLAQQTALLNSTISRQTGINNGSGFMCHSPGTPPQQHAGMQGNPIQSSTPPTGIPLPSNVMHNQTKPMQCYSSRPQSNKTMSKSNEVTSNQNDAQCQGCVTTSQIDNCASPYSKNLINNQRQFSRPNSQPGTPSREDSPVTSSTYSDRFVNVGHQQSPDLRPIQGGTISTSNGSPMEVYNPQAESSPSASSSRSANTPNTFVSSSSHFVVPSHNSPNVYSSNTSISRDNSHTPSPNVEPNQTFTNMHTMQNVQQNVSNQPKIEGYCPHPHAAGAPLDLPVALQPRTVTTMASGRTFGSNTITSVLAGRAQTATVSINTPALGATLSLPHSNNQTNQSQNQIMQIQTSKTPLEMVQSVVSNIQAPTQSQQTTINTISIANNQQISPSIVKQSPQGTHIPPGHILVSSGGQIIMTNNGQGTIMPPPPPKIVPNSGGMPPISVSPLVTNVTAAVTQVIPNVGVAQQVLGQQTVLVNALPTPFVIQPGVMTVDGMTMSQNMQIPQIVTGNVIQQQIQIDSNSDQSRNQTQFINRQPTLISPDSGKRKGKKRKLGSQTVASMLQVAAQQNAGVVIPQQQGFQTQSFQMTHSPQGVNSGSVLQSLTIVPGKGGGPPQIVMNGQPTSTAFSPQQLITGSQSTQQINLLQPVNLLNGTTGMVQNFPTIQQFIVPGLGGMVMTTDGSGNATLLPDSSVGMQLQLQNVNGQNVLTPVQNTGNTVFGTNGNQSILTAGPAGMVIRSPGTSQGKIIQQQHSPGAQFLSPNGGQFVVNGAQFNGQLSPLVASVSPSQQVTVRPASSVQHTQHEFIQCGQMGQTLMVPCQNNAPAIVSTASNQQNTTFVQQNTTIVQQQTTMLSNNQQTIQNFQTNNSMNNGSAAPTQNMSGPTTLNVDPNFVISSGQMNDKQQNSAMAMMQQSQQNMNAALLMQRHSVSTQTAVGQGPSVATVSAGAGSPPDTTTHSPLAPGADTTTHGDASPSPPTISRDHRQITHAMAMVHCISSSEPDVTDIQTVTGSHDPGDWSRSSSTGSATPKSADCTDFMIMTSNTHLLQNQVRKSVTPTYVESTMSVMNELMKPQEAIISSQKIIKRKHSDALAVLETRHLHTSLQDEDTDERKSIDDPTWSAESRSSGPCSPVSLNRGDLVWGAAHGCPAWPGKLVDGPDLGDGRVWVRWFGGDKVATAVDPTTLQTLTQGLDAHHRARKKCRKSRKLNSQLENAIQEAMIELDSMSEKGPSSSVGDKKEIIEADMKPTSSSIESSKKETTGRLRSSHSRRLQKN